MWNFKAVQEIASSSHELKIVLLPFICTNKHEIAWHGVDEMLRAGGLKEETQVAVSWAKVLYGIPLENQQEDLFIKMDVLEAPVRDAIIRAISIRYEPRR